MKALAIYSVFIIGLSLVSSSIQVLRGFDVFQNCWGIMLLVPVMVFAIKYFWEN